MTTTHPCGEGFYIFRGTRHVRHALYEHLAEPVAIVEAWRKNERVLAVAMIGRQQHFRLETYVGTWELLDPEAHA